MAIKWETLKTSDTLEQERLESLAANVRTERNKRLAATDLYMLQDAPPAPEGLTAYRQALRDITEQPGFPENVEWPDDNK